MGEVIAFPSADAGQGRLRPRDRIDLAWWEAANAGAICCRVMIHDGEGGSDPAKADLALVYNERSDWALWGLARQNGAVLLWHCPSGADIGRFETMRGALAALAQHQALLARDNPRHTRPHPASAFSGD